MPNELRRTLQPPGTKFSDPKEMALELEQLADEGRCVVCHKQMPGIFGPECEPDKEKATLAGYTWATFRDSDLVAFWWCPECSPINKRTVGLDL